MSRFEVVLNRSVDIPSVPKKKTTTHAEIQTLPLQMKDVSLEPIEPVSKSTETEKLSIKPPSAKHLRISTALIQRMVEELGRCDQENEFFRELDDFHKNQTLHMSELRATTIEMLEAVSINGLVCGQGRTLAVLCGERNHTTWCLHTGKVLVMDRQKRTWIHLGSCPTTASFAEQEQLIVGTASGEILLIFQGEIIWSSTTLHFQTVTVLNWITPKLILTAALDGRLAILNLQGNSLEKLRHSTISISELPKAMRKSNFSSLKVGIVSAANVSANEMLISTDMGAILSVDIETLDSKALGYEIEGIEQLKFNNGKLFSINANKDAKILERNGQTSEWLDISNVSCMICRKDGLCVFLTDKEIVAVRTDPTRVLMREATTLQAINVDRTGDIVGVESLKEGGLILHWFQLSDHS